MITLVPEADKPDAVLQLGGVEKAFGPVHALAAVDLVVRRGQIHALVGQNGSGKSTLVKVLAGVHTADSGGGAVDGTEFTLGNAKAAHEAGLRFVHQDLGLIPNLSAVDNLALGFGYDTDRTGRIRWKRQRARAAAALRNVVDDFPLRRDVGSLSAFEQTALAIARALQDWTENGRLLVLDEPTAAMPRAQVEHLFALLRRIRERGTSVLIVTHHLEEVFAIADRVTVLRDGAVVADRPTDQLDPAGLTRLMTGQNQKRRERGQQSGSREVALTVTGLVGEDLLDLDLELRGGDIVGIAGLSGSGRDEVCELIFGARRRLGTVEIGGRVLRPMRPSDAIDRGVGLVPSHRQRDGLIMTQTVRENLTLADLAEFTSRLRVRVRRERRTAGGWVRTLGVKTTSTETQVSALSGGNQQKIVLGKWLRLKPSVLLLDEPTQGVDVAAQGELHGLLRDAADAGTALLVCSSDELARLCDRVLVLRAGKVASELRPPELSAHRIVEECLAFATPSPTTADTDVNEPTPALEEAAR